MDSERSLAVPNQEIGSARLVLLGVGCVVTLQYGVILSLDLSFCNDDLSFHVGHLLRDDVQLMLVKQYLKCKTTFLRSYYYALFLDKSSW